MVPADFTNFFTVMAGVGATLFGLVFLVISIKPEVTSPQKALMMRQVQIASSYTALLNPLAISLLALVPHETIDTITLVMGVIGLVNTIVMSINLLQDSTGLATRLRRIIFIVGSTVIFAFEISYGIRLLITPGDVSALNDLAILLVIIYMYGIARAWDLVGARQFHIQEVLTPLIPRKIEEIFTDPPQRERTRDDDGQKIE